MEAVAQPDVAAQLQHPISIERDKPSATVTLRERGGKLFLKAAVNGSSREFVFDTGSPTILSREFATAIGARIIGQNTGRDANGVDVVMDIAVVDEINLGGTRFLDVPVLVSDFAMAPHAACLFDGGVLGSEIFAGSAWRINTERGMLTLGQNAVAVGAAADAARAKLHDFGYPHMPIVDYSVGNVTDKALFDTGNASGISVYKEVLENSSVQRKIAKGSLRRGHGSHGVSAGGAGEFTDLVHFDLRQTQIGKLKVGVMRGQARPIAPTLFGTGLLDQYVVTLDYPGKAIILEPRDTKVQSNRSADFGLQPSEENLIVAQLFDGSAASTAGVELGDRVVAVNGTEVNFTTAAEQCETMNWLLDNFDPEDVTSLSVVRDGTTKKIYLQHTP